MKMISSSRSMAVLAMALVASVLTSCQSISPKGAERQLGNAKYTEILGFNGAMAPKDRQYASYGSLPVETNNAIREYVKTGTKKSVDYARPQYYVVVDNSCWAICSDTNGNMTGIMALPQGGKGSVISKSSDARQMPASGSYELIVNETEEGPAISYAIMKRLEPADAYRKSIRHRQGLSTPTLPVAAKKAPVVQKPVAKPTVVTPAPAAPAADAMTPAPADAAETATPAAGETPAPAAETPAETPAAEGTPAAPAPAQPDLSFE